MNLIEFLKEPWPWYIAGPLIGLVVPLLLIIGNKTFGISSSLRHICAACVPGNIKFFNYDWKKESWNLFFVGGIALGGFLAMQLMMPAAYEVNVNPDLKEELSRYGISNYQGLVPSDLFNWSSVFELRSFIMLIGGGFLVGFGTRYAGGCTSGHAISGLANLQWPSLVATCCFMAGGFLMANVILPFILKL